MKQLEEQILVSCVCCFVKNIIPMRILSIAGNTLTTNMHGLLKGQVQHVCHIVYNIAHLKKFALVPSTIICFILKSLTIFHESLPRINDIMSHY